MPSGDNRMDTAYRLRDVPNEALLERERGWGQREMGKTPALSDARACSRSTN